MSDEITLIKRRFNWSLEPIKAMLIHRKDELGDIEWRTFVRKTKESIIRNPEQYLGTELPQREILELVIKEIFNEFIETN